MSPRPESAAPLARSRGRSGGLSACCGAAASGFFRSALDSYDLPILTPSRASISVMRRGIVLISCSKTAAPWSSLSSTSRHVDASSVDLPKTRFL
jgi:hypothetical protein